MTASAAVTPQRGDSSRRGRAVNRASEIPAIVVFKGTQGRVKQLALRHDDHVEAGRDFVTTKNLSNQAFSSVSSDGAAELARGRDAEPANAELVREHKHRRVAAMDFDTAVVHLLELCAAADPLGWSELQLFAADGQTLAPLRTAAFQHQPPVFGAHADQKPVRPLAAARIRLKRADSLSHDIPSRRNEPSMLANRSEKCQSMPSVLMSAPFSWPRPQPRGRSKSMQLWSLARVFHTCGKTCGKSPK